MLTGNGLERLGVGIQFFQAVRQMHHCHCAEHHPLVPGGQIVQHLPCFLPLLLQIVGNHCGIIVVAVLPPLPVCDVCLHS